MPVFWIQDQYVLMLLDKNHLTSWINFLPWSSIGRNYKNIMICVRNYFLVSSFLHIVSSLVPHQCGTTSLLPTSRSIALNFHCIDNKEQQNTVLHQEAQKLLEEAEREILPRFTALLKRRDGIMLYGRQIEHSDLDTNCATLVSFDHTEKSSHGWDATLLLSFLDVYFL